MNQTVLARLKSTDPQERRQAIIALGKSKDARALPYLAEIYRQDPDPELRELALKAGRYVKQQSGGQAAAPSPAASSPARDAADSYSAGASTYDPYTVQDDDDDVGWNAESSLPTDVSYGTGLSTSVKVSQRDVERAKGYYNRAMDLYMDGDREGATEQLAKAVAANPNLVDDLPTRNLAGELIGQEPADAIQIISSPDRLALYLGTGVEDESKWAVKQKHSDGSAPGRVVTWGDVGLDLGILFVVSAIAIVLMFLWMLPMMQASSSYSSSSVIIAPVVGLIIGLGFAAYTVFSTLVSNGAVHMVTKFFIGEGTLPQTYHALIPIQTAMTVVAYVGTLLPFFAQDLSCVGSLIMLAASIGGIYFMSQRLADAHKIGAWQGCVSLIVGPLLLGVLTAIGFALIGTLVGASLSAFLPMMGG